jgi:hypothetical protein
VGAKRVVGALAMFHMMTLGLLFTPEYLNDDPNSAVKTHLPMQQSGDAISSLLVPVLKSTFRV